MSKYKSINFPEKVSVKTFKANLSLPQTWCTSLFPWNGGALLFMRRERVICAPRGVIHMWYPQPLSGSPLPVILHFVARVLRAFELWSYLAKNAIKVAHKWFSDQTFHIEVKYCQLD